MTIAIIGGTGFLGTQLTELLLKTTHDSVRVISRNASRIEIKPKYKKRLTAIDADVLDEDAMASALSGCEVAYYFVHLMGHKNKDFYTEEARAATSFSAAAKAVGVKRVIYMGGLGDESEKLSPHLASRHNTGEILRKYLPLVVELRASMIIGNGSVAFDLIRGLVKRMPIMPLPRGANSLTQPIGLQDALTYLKEAASLPVKHHTTVEIGGPEVLTYESLYTRYAHWKGKHPLIVRIPFLPEWLGGLGLDLFTPKVHAKIGRVMVHSMSNDMVVRHKTAHALFPSVHPEAIEAAFEHAKKAEAVR